MAVTTIGVMFARGDGEFPTLADVARTNYVNTWGLDTEQLDDWLCVAWNPTVLMYSDESTRAMDVTNWQAIVTSLVSDEKDLPHIGNRYQYESGGSVWVTVGVDEANEVGYATIGGQSYGHVLIVRPDMTDELDALRNMSGRLADYPLLDEDAYSELEFEAWLDYAPMAWGDELRDAARDERYPEWLLDQLDEIDANEALNVLAEGLHYYDGFSGEYGPNFLDMMDENLGWVFVNLTIGCVRYPYQYQGK